MAGFLFLAANFGDEPMWGVAFSFNPIHWRLGFSDAMDIDPSTGNPVVVGRWFFIGPLAITYDYQ